MRNGLVKSNLFTSEIIWESVQRFNCGKFEKQAYWRRVQLHKDVLEKLEAVGILGSVFNKQ